jgi:ABC-2 type transport system ATP-binding protein
VLIDIRELSKCYGDVEVLQPFDLTIDGGVVAISGSNGSGKTTLLRRCVELISGGGVCLFGGRRYREMVRPRSQVGFACQASELPRQFRVWSLATTHGRASGVAADDVAAALGEAGLASSHRRRVGQLSSGERQRLSLALALMGRPPVLLLDEPEAGLDADGRLWLAEVLQQYRNEGRAALLATHNESTLHRDADRVMRIVRGRPVEITARRGVRISSLDRTSLSRLLERMNLEFEVSGDFEFIARGASSTVLGRAAAEANVALSMLVETDSSGTGHAADRW